MHEYSIELEFHKKIIDEMKKNNEQRNKHFDMIHEENTIAKKNKHLKSSRNTIMNGNSDNYRINKSHSLDNFALNSKLRGSQVNL